MLKKFRCDLHIHTCLSPCAELDMYPSILVERSMAAGLNVIAVCDHNASENVPYVMRAAKGTPLVVLPGMELTSREEVHTLAIFDNVEGLYAVQRIVYDALPGLNDPKVFGDQVIVNEADEVEGFNDRLLIGATDLSLEEVVLRIHEAGGLAIASHIDRESFSVLSQLGFIPKDIQFDALEISARMGGSTARECWPEYADYVFIKNSDAHFLRDLGSVYTDFMLEAPTVAEFKRAFAEMKRPKE
jgi:3',5'-nucleoside bisphosphate phosphatase